MYWALLIGGLGALYGLCLYIIAPDREFRQELTREEKMAVARGQTITKTQKGSSAFIGHNASYSQGPLRVKPGKNGKPVFEPFGEWKQVRKTGELVAEWTYTGVGRETIDRVYFPDGSLDIMSYTVPAVLNGDSVRETRVVYFVIGKPTDTLVVNHWFKKNNKEVKTNWSYDAQGNRPVPAGWKFNRY
jgi:hypothetical protein